MDALKCLFFWKYLYANLKSSNKNILSDYRVKVVRS